MIRNEYSINEVINLLEEDDEAFEFIKSKLRRQQLTSYLRNK